MACVRALPEVDLSTQIPGLMKPNKGPADATYPHAPALPFYQISSNRHDYSWQSRCCNTTSGQQLGKNQCDTSLIWKPTWKFVLHILQGRVSCGRSFTSEQAFDLCTSPSTPNERAHRRLCCCAASRCRNNSRTYGPCGVPRHIYLCRSTWHNTIFPSTAIPWVAHHTPEEIVQSATPAMKKYHGFGFNTPRFGFDPPQNTMPATFLATSPSGFDPLKDPRSPKQTP